MFTAHRRDSREAQEARTNRARRADFAAVLLKPFHIDELLSAVATAVGNRCPSAATWPPRRREPRPWSAGLRARGATDIKPSKSREWASFRDAGDRLWQINWWQSRGVYQLGCYGKDGIMASGGQFTELEGAIEVALPELERRHRPRSGERPAPRMSQPGSRPHWDLRRAPKG